MAQVLMELNGPTSCGGDRRHRSPAAYSSAQVACMSANMVGLPGLRRLGPFCSSKIVWVTPQWVAARVMFPRWPLAMRQASVFRMSVPDRPPVTTRGPAPPPPSLSSALPPLSSSLSVNAPFATWVRSTRCHASTRSATCSVPRQNAMGLSARSASSLGAAAARAAAWPAVSVTGAMDFAAVSAAFGVSGSAHTSAMTQLRFRAPKSTDSTTSWSLPAASVVAPAVASAVA